MLKRDVAEHYLNAGSYGGAYKCGTHLLRFSRASDLASLAKLLYQMCMYT